MAEMILIVDLGFEECKVEMVKLKQASDLALVN